MKLVCMTGCICAVFLCIPLKLQMLNTNRECAVLKDKTRVYECMCSVYVYVLRIVDNLLTV